MLFCTTKHVVGHETLEDERYIVIKAYMFTVLEILRDFFLSYIVSTLSLHMQSIQSL